MREMFSYEIVAVRPSAKSSRRGTKTIGFALPGAEPARRAEFAVRLASDDGS